MGLSSINVSTETKRFRSNLINLSGGFEYPVLWKKEMPDGSELAVHSSAKTNNGFELAAIRVAAVQNVCSGLSLCSMKPAETIPETILERENERKVLSSLSEASPKEKNHSFV